MDEFTKDSYLSETFSNGGKRRKWEILDSKLISDKYSIPITDIIGIRYVYKKSTVNPPDPKRFQIIYARCTKKNVWRPNTITFRHIDTNQIILWVQTLQHQLNSLINRPKKILMFVNPFGGKKKGMKIYNDYVKPLFDLACIDLRVVITQRPKQICETIIDHNLENVDGIICIGGDGTASEVFTGLIMRECQLKGIDPNDNNAVFPKLSVKVGIIPGGSTDTTSYALHGTTDVLTAILHIIMGISLGLDLVSVHYNKKLLQIYSNMASYGFLGDTAYYSEKLRWMGPRRYEYVGLKKMLRSQGYRGTINVLCENIKEDDVKCYQNCKRCSTFEDNNEKRLKWETISSNFFLLSGANVPCAGERNPHGLAPYTHLGDGYLHLIVVHYTSLYKRIKTFQRFTQSEYSIDDLPHVEVYRGKEFNFKAEGSPGRWNCDGEVILDTDIHAKVHRQQVNVYSRGVAKI